MPSLTSFLIRKTEVLFWSDVAEHRRTVPADHCRSDRGSDVIVAGGNVGDERPENVEGRAVAELDFFVDL